MIIDIEKKKVKIRGKETFGYIFQKLKALGYSKKDIANWTIEVDADEGIGFIDHGANLYVSEEIIFRDTVTNPPYKITCSGGIKPGSWEYQSTYTSQQ